MDGSNAGIAPARVGCEGLDAAAPVCHERRGSPGSTGDERRDRFVEVALLFAERLARRLRVRGEPWEDLEIKRHFQDHSCWVHVPPRVCDLHSGVSRAAADVTAELARSPTATEIARHAMIAGVPSAWPAGCSDCPRLGIAVELTTPSTVVRFSGEVDRDHAEQVRYAVVDAALLPGTARLTIDLASVPLVDAAGPAALWTADGAAARAGVDLRLATGQPFVRRVVALSRLGSRLVCR